MPIPIEEIVVGGVYEGGKRSPRPKRLEPVVTGKKVKTMFYGIKQTSDYTRDAEAYMDALAAENAEMKKLLREVRKDHLVEGCVGVSRCDRCKAVDALLCAEEAMKVEDCEHKYVAAGIWTDVLYRCHPLLICKLCKVENYAQYPCKCCGKG